MSAFTGDLDLRHQPQRWREWMLLSPLTYDVGSEGSGVSVTVPVGFETDGATVPRLLWNLLPSWGTYSRAAVIHDYLLVRMQMGLPHRCASCRREADAIFYEAMGVCGTSWPVRWLMYLAVRGFGICKEGFR